MTDQNQNHYLHTFALHLHTISPSLARIHHLHNIAPLTQLTCPRCGHTPLTTRSLRRKTANGKKAPERVVEKRCVACGFVEAVDVPVEAKSERKRKRQGHDVSTANVVASATVPLPIPEPTPASKRPKKKAGLQELLARNREQQMKEQERQQRGGLFSFLEGLS